MFMDRQELKYSLKFIKGELKQRKLQNIWATIFMLVFSIVNAIISCVIILLVKDSPTDIVIFQDYLTTAIGVMVIFPLVMYVFCYKKSTTSNLIYPQTNNSRFIKDLVMGVYIILLVIATYVFSYFFSFGAGYLVSLISDTAFVVTTIKPMHLLLACFSLLMYGLLALSFFIATGAVIRKIKLYSLAFPLIFIVLISINFEETINLILSIGKFYINEESIGIFALKILVTVIFFLTLSFIVNNKTYTENNVNYKSVKGVIVAVIFTVFGLAFTSFMLVNVSITESDFLVEEETNIEESELPKIEIDISNIADGTVLNWELNGDFVEVISYETLTKESDTLVVYYKLLETSEDLGFNLQDITEESFDAYIDGDTIYIDYNIKENLNLIYINSPFLASQFIEDEDINFITYTYIGDAYCFIELE